jgi:hypothetical protein
MWCLEEMPMPHFEFIWPLSVIRHIAEHGITPEEFEDVVLHAVRRSESRSSRRPYADDCTIVPVTAYELSRP